MLVEDMVYQNEEIRKKVTQEWGNPFHESMWFVFPWCRSLFLEDSGDRVLWNVGTWSQHIDQDPAWETFRREGAGWQLCSRPRGHHSVWQDSGLKEECLQETKEELISYLMSLTVFRGISLPLLESWDRISIKYPPKLGKIWDKATNRNKEI